MKRPRALIMTADASAERDNPDGLVADDSRRMRAGPAAQLGRVVAGTEAVDRPLTPTKIKVRGRMTLSPTTSQGLRP